MLPAANLPPHSREAEAAVLGSLLIDPDAVFRIDPGLEAQDFYFKPHEDIFKAIWVLFERGAPHSDPLVLAAELEPLPYAPSAGWESYLIELICAVPTSIHVGGYSKIVAVKGKRRKLFRAGEETASLALDEEGDFEEQAARAEAAVMAARGRYSVRAVSLPQEYIGRFKIWFDQKREHPEELAGLSTGFQELDLLLDGLQAPHQYILAGRPAMGKSALALNIAAHLALDRNKHVLMFSLEMSEHQITNRLLSWITGIDSRHKPARYSQYQLAQLKEAQQSLLDAQLGLVTAEGMTPAQIRVGAMRVHSMEALDLIVVDHLHLMKPDRAMERPDIEVGEIAKTLANLAKHLGVPLLTLAQLNRSVENRQNKRPALSDLRESGGIEENAFCVMFLYRDGYYKKLTDTPNVAELIVAKHREGPTGSVELYWEPTNTRFSDWKRDL